MADLKEGDKVLYVPGSAHHLDKDLQGDYLFDYEHVEDSTGTLRKSAGEPAHMKALGRMVHYDRDRGVMNMAGVHVVRPTSPKFYWPAKIIQIVGGAYELEIPHPQGTYTLYYRVPYDP